MVSINQSINQSICPLYIYFHRIFFISSPLFNFVFVLYVFTAAFCQQFIKEYDDDDDDDDKQKSSEVLAAKQTSFELFCECVNGSDEVCSSMSLIQTLQCYAGGWWSLYLAQRVSRCLGIYVGGYEQFWRVLRRCPD